MARRRWSFWMAPLDHAFIRYLDDRYRARLTPFGRAILWGGIAGGVFLMGGLSPGLASNFAYFWGLLGVAALTTLRPRPTVVVRREFPPPPGAGDVWAYAVHVVNVGTRPLLDISVEERGLPAALRPVEEAPTIARLEAGESKKVTLRLRCHRRGEFRLGALQVASAWPSGILKVGGLFPVGDRVLVFPRFDRLEQLEVPLGKSHQPGGVPAASKVGESAELHSLRTWREGDRLRDVSWTAFARTGRLVVREFQEEYFSRLALVVDLSASTLADEQWVERALSSAAAITDALARQEQIIDIFAAGTSVRRFSLGRALDQHDHVLELLAGLEAGDRLDVAALEEALLPELPRLSAIFLVLTGWDADRAGIVSRLRGLGLALRVLVVRPGTRVEGLGLEGLGPEEGLVLS